MKNLLLIITILLSSSVYSQGLNFEYYDTVRYVDGPFISPETVLNDISDDGYMVGYYVNEAGFRSGLLRMPDGSMSTFDFFGYNNTEITGVNDAGFVVGKAYTSSNNAAIFQASIINDIIDQAVEIDWNDPSGLSKDVGRLNNDDVASGTARISTQNWLHYEKIISPFDVSGSERYSTTGPFTTYNTYGSGLNDNGKFTGWYLDGVNRTPFIYDQISDVIFPQSHVLPLSTQPRTYLNDINNNNKVVVTYRDDNLNLQATIGTYNGNSMTYDMSFPFATLDDFELLGINNNNDVVGYMEKNNQEIVGLYFLAEGPTINDFELSDDILFFANDSATFDYAPNPFDYMTSDPYLGTNDSLYPIYMQHWNYLFSFGTDQAIRNGLQNISWPAFVKLREEDRSYITMNNGQMVPRVDELYKWTSHSDTSFMGYCYGMSLFALQNLSDPSLLTSRFPGAYIPDAAAINYDANTLAFRELFATLQLHQIGDKFNDIHIYQNGIHSAFNDNNLGAVEDLMRPDVEKVINALENGDPDSCYVLAFETNFPTAFFHAVTPFKVTRPITFGINTDTLHCIDPNYPGNVLKVFVDYISGQSRAYVNDQLVYGINFVYNNGKLSDIMPNELVDFRGEANGATKSSPANTSSLATSNLCDYTIVNQNNPSEQITATGGIYTSDWPGIGSFARMDQDDLIDNIFANEVLNIESNFTGCEDFHSFSYDYPNGSMHVSRNNVNPSETDVVSNNGVLQIIENPDNVTKNFNFTAINSTPESETVVGIKEYDLAQNEVVNFEVLDEHHILLANNMTSGKTYELIVHYADLEYVFDAGLTGIAISEETNHTIVIQPEVSNEQVVILVDEGQDGTFEDTLFGGIVTPPPPTNISNVSQLVAFDFFPNPSQHTITLSMISVVPDEFTVSIVNTIGNDMLSTIIDTKTSASKRLDIASIPTGVYFIHVKNKKGEVVAIKKMIKS